METGDGKRFSSFSDILQQIPPLDKKERVAGVSSICAALGKRKSLALKKRMRAMDTLQDMGDMAESLL